MGQETYHCFSIIASAITIIVSIFTLGYLIWYTKETSKLREAADKQLEISREQFKLSQGQFNRYMRQLRASAATDIVCNSAGFSDSPVNLQFKLLNRGSQVLNPECISSSDVKISASRPERTADGQEWYVTITPNNSSDPSWKKGKFTMSYMDSIGEKHEMTFTWEEKELRLISSHNITEEGERSSSPQN